ncbi:ABC transporter substrate-binding protein [Phytoactinopolyspora halotolerans]|uniref:ABC transporter substrate-binding protein n=1 Tax=Phytoactinopolyspora halotolerans TaxID=1981512 RepID=A0A6L9S6N9_9ACTN|nr:ABC transporter substrate-binding protein [Phytoactinopolyspora halotolerans]NEE00739.1 ABC transporter substrate-binding protein [Phytoactinopolyspora halotolerans]
MRYRNRAQQASRRDLIRRRSTLIQPSRRHFLGMAAAAGAGIPILSSCAGGVSEDDDDSGGGMGQVDISPPGKFSGRDINIVMWSAMGGVGGETLDALVEEFNESQEDIYAEVQFQGDYHESSSKLTAALQAGEIPDVMMLADTFWGRYLLNDVLEPLTDYLDDELNRDNYIDVLYDEGLVGEDLYWLSFGRSTPLFYYNKELFAEAGLPDRGPETWTELREWGAELTQLQVQGKSLKAHAFTGGDDWQFMAATWQFGGTLSDGLEVTIDSGGAVDAAEWHQRFIFEDDMAYLSQSPGEDFSAGVVATFIGSTGALGGVYEAAKFDVGTAFLPREVAQGVPTGGNGFSILKGAAQERKDAAFELLKFLSRPENSAKWTLATGYLPIVQGAADEPELAKKLDEDPNFSVAVEQLPDAQPSDAIRSYLPNGTDLIIAGIQQIYSSGSADVQSVFSDVAEELRQGAEDIADDYERYFGA